MAGHGIIEPMVGHGKGYGYPTVAAVCIVIVIACLIVFKKKKWL